MGTQQVIANKIIEKEANYILALKGNQSNLAKDVKEMFNSCKDKIDFFKDVDGSHGRIETRECKVISDPQWMKLRLNNQNPTFGLFYRQLGIFIQSNN